MDKGIRPFALNFFTEQNALRVSGQAYTGEKGNTMFRKAVMAKLMEEFGCTLAAAATHYNDAFKKVKAATPDLVAGLGRPEDKKGGRKPKAKVEPQETPSEPATTREVVLANMLAALPGTANVQPHVKAEMEEALM